MSNHCCIPETNITLYVNYTSKKKNEKEKRNCDGAASPSEKCQSPFSLQKEGITCLMPIPLPLSLCSSYFGLLIVSPMFQLALPQRFSTLLSLLPEHFSLGYLQWCGLIQFRTGASSLHLWSLSILYIWVYTYLHFQKNFKELEFIVLKLK